MCRRMRNPSARLSPLIRACLRAERAVARPSQFCVGPSPVSRVYYFRALGCSSCRLRAPTERLLQSNALGLGPHVAKLMAPFRDRIEVAQKRADRLRILQALD